MTEEKDTPQPVESEKAPESASSDTPPKIKIAAKKTAAKKTPIKKKAVKVAAGAKKADETASPTIKIGAKPKNAPRIDLAKKTAEDATQEPAPKASSEAEMQTLKKAIKKTSTQIKPARKEMQGSKADDIPEGIIEPTNVDAEKKATIFVDLDSMDEKPVAKKEKKQTSRIDISQAIPAAKKTTKAPVAEATSELQPIPEGDLAKNATLFMNIDDDILEEAGTAAPKKQTARIDISNAIPSPRETSKIGDSPATIRIKRPTTATVKRKPPTRPPEPVISSDSLKQEPAKEMVAESKKSETSRIELPPDAVRPPTRKKTVRIKRPGSTDGGTPKLSLSKPVTSSFQAAEAPRPKPMKDEAGGAFSIVSLVAIIVICVLVYVFAAQTLSSGLPFPSPIQ